MINNILLEQKHDEEFKSHILGQYYEFDLEEIEDLLIRHECIEDFEWKLDWKYIRVVFSRKVYLFRDIVKYFLISLELCLAYSST